MRSHRTVRFIRKDYDDFVDTTAKGKYHAVIDQIVECHKKGQPVLVGTVSIESRNLLSQTVDRRGIKHTVLNASSTRRKRRS